MPYRRIEQLCLLEDVLTSTAFKEELWSHITMKFSSIKKLAKRT